MHEHDLSVLCSASPLHFSDYYFSERRGLDEPGYSVLKEQQHRGTTLPNTSSPYICLSILSLPEERSF